MDLVLYDTEHFETVYTWIRLLAAPERRLHLLVPDTLRGQLEAMGTSTSDAIEWHPLPGSNEAHPKAVEQLVRKLRAPLLILGTVSFRHYGFARASRRLTGCKVVLGLHDIEDSFRPTRGSGLKALFRWWGKKRLAASVSAFAVLLPEMKNYLLQQEYTRKPIYVVPGRLFEESNYQLPPDGPLWIVVPGSIDPARRDYEALRKLAEQLDKNGTTDIRILIVGAASYKAFSPSWFHSFPHLLEVRTGAFVPPGEYAGALAEASLVWAPLPEKFEVAGKRDEYYGKSKSSGTFFDAISAGRPLLLPAHMTVPESLRACTLTYAEDEELYYLLRALADNAGACKSLQLLARNAAS
ncbi:MAG: hypothetical protein EOO15_21885, partial [Chitinophagaceae bacterium]